MRGCGSFYLCWMLFIICILSDMGSYTRRFTTRLPLPVRNYGWRGSYYCGGGSFFIVHFRSIGDPVTEELGVGLLVWIGWCGDYGLGVLVVLGW